MIHMNVPFKAYIILQCFLRIDQIESTCKQTSLINFNYFSEVPIAMLKTTAISIREVMQEIEIYLHQRDCLQCVHNTAGRILTRNLIMSKSRTIKFNQITSILSGLHWPQ